MSARSGVVALALLAVGCGGAQRTASAPPPPRVHVSAAFDDCLRPGPAVQMVKVPAPGEQLPAVVLGSGAVVSLSGERVLAGQRDIIVDARRLDMPALWVSSRNDGYTNFAAETRQLYRAAGGHARPDRLLVVGRPRHRPAHRASGTARRAGGDALHPLGLTGPRGVGQRSSVQPISQNASS